MFTEIELSTVRNPLTFRDYFTHRVRCKHLVLMDQQFDVVKVNVLNIFGV
jgi:hypothetical protein